MLRISIYLLFRRKIIALQRKSRPDLISQQRAGSICVSAIDQLVIDLIPSQCQMTAGHSCYLTDVRSLDDLSSIYIEGNLLLETDNTIFSLSTLDRVEGGGRSRSLKRDFPARKLESNFLLR